MLTYITIIYEFFKVGLFSIGGGLATLPFLFELAEKYPWFTSEELTNMIAVSESTPGPIGVNMATFAGFKAVGVMGGVLSTLSLVAPSVIIIIFVAHILDRFKDSIVIKDLFYGIRAAVAGVIAASVVGILSQNLVVPGETQIFYMLDYKKIIVFATMVFGVFRFKKHPLLYIAAGAFLGILFKL